MELMIPLKAGSHKALYEQIYEYLKKEIRGGSLKEGTRLPSTRVLAENLKVSRSTTQMAYDQLVAEGYVKAMPHRGYFVLRMEEIVEVETRLPGGFIRDQEPDSGGAVIDFSPRGIDLTHFPYNVWRKVTKNTLVEDNKEMFLTGPPQGEPALREAIRGYLHAARGVNCGADQIIIGAGNEYLLMLLCQILGPGRTIAMETPTYRQACRVFESLGYCIAPVDMDGSGMDIEALKIGEADIAYVMPSHQYPTGVVMPIARRQELLKWAGGKKGRFLIEDDYDSEFRYRGKPIPALQGLDKAGKVIYMGTFSQSIAPAIRIGYIVLPQPLLEIYQQRLGFYASTVSRIDQKILYQFLTEGYYERHLNRMRAIYRGKHDTLLGQLKKLDKDFEITGENAGLHILLTSKKGRQEDWLIGKAKDKGVKVYGLSSYFIRPCSSGFSSTVMLGYARVSEEQIARGVQLLWEAWGEK